MIKTLGKRGILTLVVCFLLVSVFLMAGCKDSAQINSMDTSASTREDIITGPEDEVLTTEEETAEKTENESVTVEAVEPLVYDSVDETVYATVNVNIRIGADTSFARAGLLKKGQPVRRTGYHESWSRVLFNDKECYISSSYLTREEPAAVPVQSEGTGAAYGSGERIVAIDPGHQRKGNNEKEPDGPGSSTMKAKVAGGATGAATGLAEYELTLQVSLKLKEELLRRGYQVIMIRGSHDVNISNAERAEIANKSGASAFVRIHGNSIGDSSVHGALTMCPSSANPYIGNLYESSYSLSKNILDSLCAATGAKNRGVTKTDTMSGINWCTIPVSIVEMGFMSNPDEDRNMASEDYQNKLAKGIADGIDAYFGK